MSNSVLIVDDSSTIRRRISDLLSKIPGVGDIYEAVDGQMAVDRIKRLTPRIVILDLRMPKMSGLQVLEKILKNGSGPTFIVLTNFPLPNYHDICTRAGADYFLDKSTEFERLTEIILEIMEE